MTTAISGEDETKIRLANNLWQGGGRGLSVRYGFDIALHALAVQMGTSSINGTVQSKFQKDNQKQHW